MLALAMILLGGMNVMALETYDFQDLCMALGKGGPWAVNDGGDAGFTLGTEEAPVVMHFLGDYTDQGFSWNQRFAYEYVDGRGKFTMRNKSNKRDKNCGMFSWDYAHCFSILDLKDGDKVTITTLAGTTSFVSTNVTAEVNEGDAVASGTAYTISTTDETTRLDVSMAAATLISKIVIEPYGVETVPVITVTPKTLTLIPGATAKLKADVSPAADSKWISSDEAVVTVAEDGTITAVAAGTATIINKWESTISDAMASDACEVTVADVNLSAYTATTIDFTTMGDVTLTLGDKAGAIWNAANSKNNDVFWCTNEGLERIAVQAAVSNNKGWSIVNGSGLFLGTGAGRCAAIGGIKKDQLVEFIYTGSDFYTKSDKSDAGIAKTALNEATGRAIYQADEDGMIGFELVKGNAVKQIIIYSTPLIDAKAALQDAIALATMLNTFAKDDDLATAIAAAQTAVADEAATLMTLAAAGKNLNDAATAAAKNTLHNVIVLAESFGIDVTAANAVLNNDESTVEDYVAALQNLAVVAKAEMAKYVALVKEFLDIFDKTAAVALAEDIAAFEAIAAGNDVAAIQEAMSDLMNKAMPYAQADMKKVFTYLEAMEDETLNADIADIKAAAGALALGGKDIQALFTAAIKLADDFKVAAPVYIEKVKTLAAEYKEKGEDVSALETAIEEAVTVLASEEADVVAKGEAIYKLIKAVEEFKVTVGINAVSTADKNAVIFNMAGQRVAAPVKGINIINGKKVLK